MSVATRIAFGLDGNESWYDVIARYNTIDREIFIDIFKPAEVHVPAEVLAKCFCERLKNNYPKTWMALTNGSMVCEIIAADGAPIMPKFVKELNKLPQFATSQYKHDRCHSFNLLTQKVTEQNPTSLNNSSLHNILAQISGLTSRSECVMKDYRLNFAEFRSDMDGDYVYDFCSNDENGAPHDFLRHKFPKTLPPTRFLGCDIFYGSHAYCLPITVKILMGLRVTGTEERKAMATGALRSISDLIFQFDFAFNHRYYKVMGYCNKRLQAMGLTKNACLQAYADLIERLIELKESLSDLETTVKRITTQYMEVIGHVGVVTRRTIQLAEVQSTTISMFKYETAIDDTITMVKQRIESETESCDDSLLLSSMYCESIFSGSNTK